MCTPEQLISSIRSSFIGSEQVYTQGSCILFYQILKTVYPGAKPYWSNKARHMITKIGKEYYDITGKVECTPDYTHDGKEEYASISIAVAFPQKGTRCKRFTTPKKL